MKKTVSLMTALILCTALASCGKGAEIVSPINNPSDVEIDSSHFPYGTTLTELKSTSNDKIKITTQYDNRYFTEDEIVKVSEYFHAIQTADLSELEECFYMPFYGYLAFYQGFSENQQLLDATKNDFTEIFGEGFSVDYLDIASCETNENHDNDSTFKVIDDNLNGSSDENIVAKVTSRKKIEIGGYSSISLPDGTSTQLVSKTSPIELYIYEIDGQIYIV